MSHNQDYEEFRYSQSVDLCIRWGRACLMGNDSAYLQNLEAKWDQRAANSIDIRQDLADGFTHLSKRIESALALLASDATLNLDQDDAPLISAFEGWGAEDLKKGGRADGYRRLNGALLTLDALAYLSAASASFSRIEDQAAFREQVQRFFNDIFEKKPLFSLRLVPINVLRKKRLQSFPESERYLFPWYEEWSDLPPEALDVVAETAAGWPNSVEIADGTLFMLQRELMGDPALLARIESDAKIMRLTFAALDEAHALRFLLAADEKAGKGEMPEIVVRAGMVGAACRLAVKAIRAKAETVDWKFRAGLCGLGLEDEERLRLMKPVESALREAKRKNGVLKGFAWRIEAFPSDTALAESFFTDWLRDLESVAQEGFMPLPEIWNDYLYRRLLFDENPAPIANLIAGLDALRSSSLSRLARSLLEKLRDLPEYSSTPLSVVGGELGSKDEKEERPQQPEQLDFLLLTMPKVQEHCGKRIRDLLQEVEADKWRKALSDAGLFYWGGVGITEAKEVRLGIQEASVPLIRIGPENYRLFLLGISLDKEALRTALEAPDTLSRVMAEGKPKGSGTAWVLYVQPGDDPNAG